MKTCGWSSMQKNLEEFSLNLGPLNTLVFEEDLKKFRVVYSVTRYDAGFSLQLASNVSWVH